MKPALYSSPYDVQIGILDSALKTALGTKYVTFATLGNRAGTMYLDDNASQSDIDAMNVIVSAHDPVFIACDKTQIKADDIERCAITVTAPKSGALPVILQIVCNGSAPLDLPVSLAGGVGSDFFTCKDPGTVTITVKNGNNRSIDILTVKAI